MPIGRFFIRRVIINGYVRGVERPDKVYRAFPKPAFVLIGDLGCRETNKPFAVTITHPKTVQVNEILCWVGLNVEEKLGRNLREIEPFVDDRIERFDFPEVST